MPSVVVANLTYLLIFLFFLFSILFSRFPFHVFSVCFVLTFFSIKANCEIYMMQSQVFLNKVKK